MSDFNSPLPQPEPPQAPEPLPAPTPAPTPFETDVRTDRWHHRRSIFFPLFLVAAGVIFLLYNLGTLSGASLENILRLWPILLIVGGLDGLWRGEGIAGSIFWAGVGVIFLLGNLGLITVSTWQIISNYWPVLLIAIGLDVLIGRRRAGVWAQVLAVVLAVALLAGIVWMATANPLTGAALTSDQISQPLQSATSGRVDLNVSAGDLRLAGGAPSDQFVQGTIRVNNNHRITQDYSVQSGTAALRIREDGVNVGINTGSNFVWDLKFSSSTPTDMKVNMGAGDARLDLSTIKLSGLNYNMGVGQVIVVLPSTGGYSASVGEAVGSMIVRVPRDLPINIRVSRAITGLSVENGFTRNGSLVQNAGAGGTPVELSINNAIGSIVIEYIK